MEMYLTLQVCFDSRTILRTDIMKKRDKKSTFLEVMKSICDIIRTCCQRRKRQSSRRSQSIISEVADESIRLLPAGKLIVVTDDSSGINGIEPILSVKMLSYGFEIHQDDEGGSSVNVEDSEGVRFRTLFENISFDVYPGSTTLVSGDSGVGKSSLLRILAGLVHGDAEKIFLSGTSQSNYINMPLYRKKCRYVPQTKVDIPGTPFDFMDKIASFKSWKSTVGGTLPTHSELRNAAKELIRSWGMNNSLLDSEWKVLSGGESQRILVAIALASLPDNGVILLDESTSALDLENKLKVETSVYEYCTRKLVSAVWITHDRGQQDRMKSK
jgi:putative ABC transport system ATP-binding protein